jgi:hypothetical protein
MICKSSPLIVSPGFGKRGDRTTRSAFIEPTTIMFVMCKFYSIHLPPRIDGDGVFRWLECSLYRWSHE